MTTAALHRFDLTQLFTALRRSVAGALGWVLVVTGAVAAVTPIPFAVPVLFAGILLLEQTNPPAAARLLGVVDSVRRRLRAFGRGTRRRVQWLLF